MTTFSLSFCAHAWNLECTVHTAYYSEYTITVLRTIYCRIAVYWIGLVIAFRSWQDIRRAKILDRFNKNDDIPVDRSVCPSIITRNQYNTCWYSAMDICNLCHTFIRHMRPNTDIMVLIRVSMHVVNGIRQNQQTWCGTTLFKSRSVFSIVIYTLQRWCFSTSRDLV